MQAATVPRQARFSAASSAASEQIHDPSLRGQRERAELSILRDGEAGTGLAVYDDGLGCTHGSDEVGRATVHVDCESPHDVVKAQVGVKEGVSQLLHVRVDPRWHTEKRANDRRGRRDVAPTGLEAEGWPPAERHQG